MATQLETTGTTLEALAPYLPYGIEVQWKHGQARHYELTGLVTQTSTCYLEGKYSAFAEDLLPVLRPFSALCTPLEDGTVPACELAKICLGEEVDFENETAFYDAPDEDEDEDGDTHQVEETVEVTATDFHTDARIRFTIYPDWTWYGYGESDNCAPAAAIDYLRSKHFAVGLEPHQYIPKSPAPVTPAIERGPGA